ncbi:MAG: 4-hydroxy-tetrahydrodipicolinate reductase [Lentisphaerae bacterium GWF2_45_14]|nr:MAG: 4-hydroxy-tetrahydrodipicolinate reductase [Lentisphaerae bacterium GWF2_45_14]
MIKVIVTGAAGRMGKRLVANVLNSEDMQLAGAVEIPASPDIGKDAGTVAGLQEAGVKITTELAPLLENADAVIDFSTGPVVKNAKLAVSKNCSVVIGTTALSEEEKLELKKLAENGGKIVQAPNMSVGVNLLFHLAREVTKILGNGYDIEIVEMHHNQKKDAPSGTAARLAEIIAAEKNLSYKDDVRHGREGITGARTPNEIGMHALRGGDVVGDHTVIFATEGERVELTHKASSRDTFAKGAVRAARFLYHAKPGFYDMQDVLNLSK